MDGANGHGTTVSPLPHSIEAMLEQPYARYLDIDRVYAIQTAIHGDEPLRHPDEVLFRSVHITCEVWLRLAALEIERATDVLQAHQPALATRLLHRARLSLERVMEASSMLEMMTPADYHQFRVYLTGASGLQSPGYAYVRRECRRACQVLDRLVPDDNGLYALYTTQRDDPLYDACEGYFEIDATLDRFRALHLQIAERFLGERTHGTGGSEGVHYLRRNLGHRLFPRLWQVRQRISDAAGPVEYVIPDEEQRH